MPSTGGLILLAVISQDCLLPMLADYTAFNTIAAIGTWVVAAHPRSKIVKHLRPLNYTWLWSQPAGSQSPLIVNPKWLASRDF